MSEVEFPKGLMVKAPRDGSPEFVKGSISIKRVELIEWLKGKDSEWINLDIKVSKNDKYYVQVNNWKPNPKRDGYSEDVVNREFAKAINNEFKDDEIPF